MGLKKEVPRSLIVINFINFISKNGEKVPKNQKIFLIFFIIHFFKTEIRPKKKKQNKTNKKPSV
jgi:p-aminobenzoyl-glutamate transporter AbgT